MHFSQRCLAWARRTVIWVVPAQHGPRGMCFAGCLPAAWHGEDETPGVDIVLRGLAPSARPHAIAVAEWTFSGIVADVEALAIYLADRLGWPEQPPSGNGRASCPPGQTRRRRLPARYSEKIRGSRLDTCRGGVP